VIPKLGDRLVAIIEQGGTAKATFNTIDRTFDSIITTMVFSYYKPNLCTEIVKEQLQTGYNFIYLHSRDLKPLNHEVVSAYRVFRHAGTDVNVVPDANAPQPRCVDSIGQPFFRCPMSRRAISGEPRWIRAMSPRRKSCVLNVL
jgi:hypothetical protein